MKQGIFTLLAVTAIYLTSCKKEEVAPTPATEQAPTTATTTTSQTQVDASTSVNPATVALNITGSLKLQLAKDSVNTDNVLIGFVPTAKAAYVSSEDATKLQGFGLESLAALSSDNKALAIDETPLTNKDVTIGLNVTAKSDGIYKLNMITIKAIPALFDIWLKDNYAKDSVNFRTYPSYAFNIYNADPASFGSGRFSLVIRENSALAFHFLSFTALKQQAGAQMTWKTENENAYTSFTVQRSTDNGQTYTAVTSLMSASAGTYTFLDKAPSKGSNMYRLKMQDLNGTISYSGVISLTF